MSKKAIKPGDLVRVGRDQWHGVRFGALGTVLRVEDDGDLLVKAPLIPKQCWSKEQWVDGAKCKLAKQAMKRGAV